MADGGETIPAADRSVRLVRNRHALVRADYSLEGSWTEREIEGRLTLYHASGDTEVLRDQRMVDADADLTTLGGTFEWRLEPEQMTAGLQYSVGLYEVGVRGTVVRGSSARIPAEGSDELGVSDESMRLEVVVVKVAVGGTTAVFDDANLESLRRSLYEHNPVEEVDVTLREPEVTSASCKGDNGVTCLKTVEQARAADSPDPHVYYLGLGHEGNVGGVSNVASPTMQAAAQRASFAWVGTGAWEGNLGVQIAGHELGHAQNSPHTPGCGAAGAVSDYPHVNGDGESELGGQGYEILDDVLHDPRETFDIMCYCQPHWSGDYTYEKWAGVISELSTWPQRYADERPEKVELLRGFVGQSGESMWWIVHETRPTSGMTRADAAKVRVATLDGEISGPAVYVADLADAPVRSMFVELPADAADLATIDIELDRETVHVDRPAELKAAYEQLRRQ